MCEGVHIVLCLQILFMSGRESGCQSFQGLWKLQFHCTCTNTLLLRFQFIMCDEGAFSTCSDLSFVLCDAFNWSDNAGRYQVCVCGWLCKVANVNEWW